MQRSPWPPVSEKDTWPEHSVEIDVVFAHELEQANILMIKPPLFPLWGITCCYARVSKRRIKLTVASEINP
jgi:hypothetical protein